MFEWEPQLLDLLNQGQLNEALRFLETLQQRQIGDSERRLILFNEAACLRDMGELTEAWKLYEHLITIRGLGIEERCSILLSAAKCLQELGEFKKASRCLREIHELDDTDGFSLYCEFAEINLEFAEGKLDEAINHAELFLTQHHDELGESEYQRNAYDLQLKVACELITARQFQRGINSIRQFLPKAHEEDLALLHLFLGLAYDALGESDNAIGSFNEVLRLNGAEDLLVRAHYQLGTQYLKKDALAWAKQHLQEAENLRGALKNIPLKSLYLYLASTCGRLGEQQEQERYTRMANQS
jgi:tetratricopeptide (TPR) repeat protein